MLTSRVMLHRLYPAPCTLQTHIDHRTAPGRLYTAGAHLLAKNLDSRTKSARFSYRVKSHHGLIARIDNLSRLSAFPCTSFPFLSSPSKALPQFLVLTFHRQDNFDLQFESFLDFGIKLLRSLFNSMLRGPFLTHMRNLRPKEGKLDLPSP